MGVFAPLVGVIGSAQATEALKLLMHMGEPMVGRLALFNSTQFKWTEIGYKKNSTCVVCSQQKTP
jgi:molybdopterin/thiamine biosynthesis adenylyltransferase